MKSRDSKPRHPRRRALSFVVGSAVATVVVVTMLTVLGGPEPIGSEDPDVRNAALLDAPAVDDDPSAPEVPTDDSDARPDDGFPSVAGEAGDDVVVDDKVLGDVIVTAEPGESLPERGSIIAGTTVDDVEIVVDDEDGVVAKLTLADGERTDDALIQLEEAGLASQPNYVYRSVDVPDGDESESSGTVRASGISSSMADGAMPRAIANDTYYPHQYSHKPWISTDVDMSTASMGANVSAAWDLFRSNGRVTVAVIDTGCQADHPDLVANIDAEHMRDVTNDTAPGIMWDSDSHGTHVCGIVAATADNGKGVAGASYNARVLPIRASHNSPGGEFPTANLLRAYDYLDDLVESGELTDLRVINMSLGMYLEDGADDALEREIVHMRTEHDVLTVAAGGNGDGETGEPLTAHFYPADYDSVVSVTSLEENGDDSPWSDYNECKDISAPGVDIASTVPGGRYANLGGTSMASPLVAGIAGLLYAADPSLTPDDVVRIIQQTANPLRMTDNHARRANGTGGVKTGSPGAIDAERALRSVLVERLGITRFIEPGDVQIVGGSRFEYTGEPIHPYVVVVHDGETLREGLDYAVRYTGGIDPGMATVLVEGIDQWRGCTGIDYEISIDLSEITHIGQTTVQGLADKRFSYTGFSILPSLKVMDGGYELVLNEDYEVEVRDNVGAGTASIVLFGRGLYGGANTLYFTIDKATPEVVLSEGDLVIHDDEWYTREIPVSLEIAGTYAIVAPIDSYSSSNTNVATVTERDGSLFVTPVGVGEATITVRTSETPDIHAGTATMRVEVVDEPHADEGADRVPDPIPVHRLYNPYDQVHLYTTDAGEVASLRTSGWRYENIAWYAPQTGTGAETLVRLYNPWNNDHYYVRQSDYAQLNSLTRQGWVIDGERSWFDSAAPDEGYEVFTLFNPHRDRDTHLWTIDGNELYGNLELGWRQDSTSIWAAEPY